MDVMDAARTTWLNRLIGALARRGLRLLGWHVEGGLPDAPKFVAIGAPHTWWGDMPISLVAFAAATEGFATMRLAWLGKHTLFRGPLGALLRRFGGIPVNRGAGHHVVRPVLKAFEQNARLALVLAPEGTRKKVEAWKPGFYYISRLAHVPIACGYLDYSRKAAGFGPLVCPSGDVDADMQIIRDFYTHVSAKYPERVGPIRLQRERT